MDQEQPINKLSSSNLEDDTSETFQIVNSSAIELLQENRDTTGPHKPRRGKKSPKDNSGKAPTPADLASTNTSKAGLSKEKAKRRNEDADSTSTTTSEDEDGLLRGMLERE